MVGVGAEDSELTAAPVAASALWLQLRFTDIVDHRVGAALAESLRKANRTADFVRRAEISHPDCSHEWLWQTHWPRLHASGVRYRRAAASWDGWARRARR